MLRYRVTATATLPGAAAVGVEQRIVSMVEDRLPDSDPAVTVDLTDQVVLGFTLRAASAFEARADGRALAHDVLSGAAPIHLEAVEQALTAPLIV